MPTPDAVSRIVSYREGPEVVWRHETASVFAGGGEMGQLMAEVDWSTTAIGSVDTWPQSLRTSVSVCLASRFPILLWWGPELVMLYNDAYRVLLGATKHPAALGQRGCECWPEIWDLIGPMLEGVLEGEAATWSEDQLLPLDRNGFVEECYFTFSYSPIRDETGIGGVFTAVTETTERVVGERRLAALHDLAALVPGSHGPAEVARRAADVLGSYPDDLPSGAIALAGSAGELALVAGWGPPSEQSRLAAEAPWRAVEGDEVVPLGPPAESTAEASLVGRKLFLGDAEPGVLVLVRNPRRPWDEDYASFAGLIADQISVLLSDARAREAERQRALALAQLDRAKTAFFSNISHEFRTPLTLILGPLEERLRATPDDAELALAHRNSLRLQRLVNTLLEFSRSEARRTEPCFEPTDLAQLSEDLAGAFRSVIESAGLSLHVSCEPLPEPAYVDVEMWERVMFNLLSNALKFTFSGSIKVGLRADGGFAALTVSDSGIGIPESALPQLFERFYRVEGTRGRSIEGSGIGLALSRDLVRLHKGEITVESTLGAGTTFRVRIPLGSAHLSSEQISAAPLRHERAIGAALIDEARSWLADDPASPPDTGVAAASSARILVADDNGDMRGYLVRALAGLGTVIGVADGESALSELRRRPADLLVSDVMMPGIGGLELVRRVRSDPAVEDMSIVLLSARAGEEAAAEGLGSGADDYLVKPFSIGELQARVAAQLDSSRRRRRDHWLQRLMSDLNKVHEPDESAELLVSYTRALVGEADVRVVYLAEDGETMRVVVGAATDDDSTGADVSPAPGETPAAPAARDLLLVPLSVGSARLGVLSVSAPGLDTSVRLALKEFAERVAYALERARTQAAERRARASAERAAARSEALRAFTQKLTAAATVEEVAAALGDEPGLVDASGGGLCLVEDDELREAARWRLPGTADAELQRIPLTLETPATKVSRTGTAVVLESSAEIAAAFPSLAGTFAAQAVSAGIYLPLGLQPPHDVLYWRFESAHTVEREERILLETVASVASQALDRARTHDADRRVAHVLQTALLDRELPAARGVSIGVAYKPSESDSEIGGDWYDVIDLPDGELGVAVGDVVGHGIRAATAMGRLRAALHALALDDRSPARVIERLDRFALDTPGAEMTTVFYGVLSRDRSRFTYTRAGHVPGLIVRADGTGIVLDGGSTLPLAALGRIAPSETEATLAPGELLLLCSDGLIERRREHLDRGLDRLLGAAASSRALTAQSACDEIMHALTGSESLRDDAALLAVRRLPVGAHLFSARLPARPGSLAPLRADLRRFLEGFPLPEGRRYDIVLTCGEVAANAIEHAYSDEGGELCVDLLVWGANIRLEVRDGGCWRDPQLSELRGRGLSIVASLSHGFEIVRAGGTRVTVDL